MNQPKTPLKALQRLSAVAQTAEQKHVTDTMSVGSMSLIASRIAVKKARDEDVKAFAEFEVAQQESSAMC